MLSFGASSQTASWLFKANLPDDCYATGLSLRYKNSKQPESFKNYGEKEGLFQSISFYIVAKNKSNQDIESNQRLKTWDKKIDGHQIDTYSLTNTEAAAIDISIWGCTLLSDYSKEILAKPGTTKPKFVKDIIQIAFEKSGNQFIKTIPGHEYLLLVFNLSDQNGTKEFFKERVNNKLNSQQQYLIWDKTANPSLPQELINAKYETYRIQMQEPEPSTIFFDRSPEWGKTSITLVRVDGKREPKKVAFGESIPFDRSKYTKLFIKKPYGYNIAGKNQSDTLALMNSDYELEPSEVEGPDTLRMIPISYKIIYIDPTRSNYIAISQSIDKIMQNQSGYFYAYLAWKSKPIIATTNNELNDLKSKLYELAFDAAHYESDLRRITSDLSPKISLIAKRMNVTLDLFLPWEICDEKTALFLKRFDEKDFLLKQKILSNLYIYGTSPENIDRTKIKHTHIHELNEH